MVIVPRCTTQRGDAGAFQDVQVRDDPAEGPEPLRLIRGIEVVRIFKQRAELMQVVLDLPVAGLRERVVVPRQAPGIFATRCLTRAMSWWVNPVR